MSVSSDVVEIQYTGVVADIPIDCLMKAFTEDTIYVYYCNARVAATRGDDFTVAVSEDVSFASFTVTPLAPLIDKINDFITSHPGEQNIITVRRQLLYISDFEETDSFLRAKIAQEFDKTIMRMQQLEHDFSLIVDFSDAARTAVAAAVAASASADTATAQAAIAVAAKDAVLAQDITNKADKATTIGVSGLATGGGSLAANRTIGVPASSNAQAIAGTDTTTAVTPAALEAAMAVLRVGMCFSIAGTSIPAGMRVLKRNGALVPRASYPALWAFAQASGALLAEVDWLAGGSGGFSTGDLFTNFRLPDDRGYFERAFDDARGVDAGRVLYLTQADTFKDHTHPIAGALNTTSAVAAAGHAFGDAVTGNTGNASVGAGTETRPKNNAKLAVIGY